MYHKAQEFIHCCLLERPQTTSQNHTRLHGNAPENLPSKTLCVDVVKVL